VHVRHHETILLKLRSKQDDQSVKRRKFDSDQQLIIICMNFFLHLRTLNLRNTGTPIDKILRIKLPVDQRDLCRSTAGTSSTGHKMSSTINPGLKCSSSFVHASYRRCNQPATNAIGTRNNRTRDSPHRIPSTQQVPF
jgi:hypothetical protein